jgi:hypothetical protein
VRWNEPADCRVILLTVKAAGADRFIAAKFAELSNQTRTDGENLMTKSKTENRELSDDELVKVSGGLNPQPLPPGEHLLSTLRFPNSFPPETNI